MKRSAPRTASRVPLVSPARGPESAQTAVMRWDQQSGAQADPPTVADRVARVLSDDELVDEASEESFPASDPPAWCSGTDRTIETQRLPERRSNQR
jgi:hypothetical protein